MSSLLDVPTDILATLPDYLHDIEDYNNLTSTCRTLRVGLSVATPRQILRLAISASKVFFRPSPYFLVAATARELGHWARLSTENENELATKLQDGIDVLLDLAAQHCGLTMARIRELYEMRFSLINPVANIMDQCVGKQWYGSENFWNGGVSDAYTIHGDPRMSVFHLAIYGELFGPDFETYLNQDSNFQPLRMETRLEFVKYCIPDYGTNDWPLNQIHQLPSALSPPASMDPRRRAENTGPYLMPKPDENLKYQFLDDNNLALTWILKSSRWRPHWQAMRALAGPELGELNDHGSRIGGDWRQRLWESCMVSQGLRGYEMIMEQSRDAWIEKVEDWREKIENLIVEPSRVYVGRTWTYDYPWLFGDLRVLRS